MAEDTKACSLSEYEIRSLIFIHGGIISQDIDTAVERINYLYRRLKAEKKDKTEEQPKAQMTDTQSDAINAAASANPVKDGW